jgi:hypothetical protein
VFNAAQTQDIVKGGGGMTFNAPMVTFTGPVNIRDDSDIDKLSRGLGRHISNALRAQGSSI